MEVAIPSGQSDRVNVLAPGSRVSVDPPTSLAHERDGADTDRKVSDDEWLAKAKQKGIRVRSQPDVLVCVVAQDDFEENHLLYVWSRSGRMSKCS